MADRDFERTFAALPPHLKKEVENFAECLLSKRTADDKAVDHSHPLASLAGAWQDELLSDEDLLPSRTSGREVDL